MKLREGTEFASYLSTPAFWQACEQDSAFLSRLNVIVTDYNFAPNDPADGASFAKDLRARGFRGVLLLASGESFLEPEIEALFDAQIGKLPLSFARFLEAVEAARGGKARA